MEGLELTPWHPEVLEPAYKTTDLILKHAIEMGIPPVRLTSTAPGGIAIYFLDKFHKDPRGHEYIIIECYNDGRCAVLWDSPYDASPLHWIMWEGERHSLQNSLKKIQERLASRKSVNS